jgi:hypothetical protein
MKHQQTPRYKAEPNKASAIDNHCHIHDMPKHEMEREEVHHLWHFLFTLLSFGLWGLIWWRAILKSQGKQGQFFHGFDDAYWSHLIEREQPPAALHRLEFDQAHPSYHFDA